MNGIEIRRLGGDEFAAALAISAIAFGEEYTEEDAEAFRQAFDFDRALCAFEGAKMVGTCAVLPLDLTLPGRVSIPLAGLTWVAVLPTHRRRGILRRLMLAQFADMAVRGEAITGLGASEGNIYGRFGYGPATSFTSFSVERAHAAFHSHAEGASAGRITLLDRTEAAAELPDIYESLRLLQPGAVSRPPGWWKAHLHDSLLDRDGAGKMYHTKHETIPGIADGYVSYRIKDEWAGVSAQYDVRVVDLLAADPGVYRALWNYLLTTDLCQTVSCQTGRTDEPLRWLLADPRRFKVNAMADFLWLRLLDVPRALAARAYGSTGRLVLEVAETFPTPGASRFALEVHSAGGPQVECAHTASEPDLTLKIDALGAAYLGGVTFGSLAAAGRAKQLRAGAIDHADAMFSGGPAPFCMTEF
ncbi:MAG: hypothetical protein A2133_06580 [Actinobacteria bacterium RBG_16_64_13]|nr:MAG: hypothetical protein A2133_06580 [Actinobacteria bacterium RBG_16_64_13]